jgi:hypothetical protein
MLIYSLQPGGAMSKKLKVSITYRALIQRINRKLAADDEQLKATRGDRWRSDLGDYYIVNVNRNNLVAQHVDPVELGRELGVLRPWEEVADN